MPSLSHCILPPKVFSGGLLVLSLFTCTRAAAINLTIVHMNDDHSHVSGGHFDIRAGIPSDLTISTNRIRVYYGGYPRLVTLVRTLSEAAIAAGRSVLKIHAGDTMTGTSFYTLWKGIVDAQMMNKICFDTFSLGNHEFDDGDANLAAFIDELHSSVPQCTGTQVIAANVHPGSSSPLVGKLSKSVVREMQGEKVGIIGIDIRSKTLKSSRPDPGTTLSDEKTAAQAEIDALAAAGVNKIILSTHIGYNNDKSWMTTLKGVDIIIGGDSHSLLGDSNTISGNVAGPYPTSEYTNADGDKVCIAQAWENAHGVGELNVAFDSAGVVTSCSGSVKFPFDAAKFTDKDANADLGAADAQTMTKYLESLSGQYVPIVEDTPTLTALEVYSDQIEVLKTRTVATVSEDICFDRFPGQGKSETCDANATQKQGGAVCNLVAKSFLYLTPTADIGINNGGGCRADIGKGNFTFNSAYEVLPFSNTLVTLSMTGSQIKMLIEDALDFGLDPEGSTGAYPYASGLRFDIDASKAKGSRVTNVEVNPRLAASWDSISDTTSYIVVTSDYLAGGRDGYVTFSESSVASSLVNTYTEYAQAFINYAEEVKILVAPALSEFSTQAYIDSAGVSHGNGARDTDDFTVSAASSMGRWWLAVPWVLLLRLRALRL